jgi:hypothetical protein
MVFRQAVLGSDSLITVCCVSLHISHSLSKFVFHPLTVVVKYLLYSYSLIRVHLSDVGEAFITAPVFKKCLQRKGQKNAH